MSCCPNSAASGCRCPDHAPGLTAYAKSAAYGRALERLAPTRLRVVTMPKPEVCHGYAHGCSCSACSLRAEHGGALPDATRSTRQPWEPRPARHRRAA